MWKRIRRDDGQSTVEYVLVVLAAATLAMVLVGWVGGSSLIPSFFAAVLDTQVLIGLVLLVVRPFYAALTGHVVLMLAAAAAAHVSGVINKRRGEGQRSSAVGLAGVVLPLVLIVGGILAIGRTVL